MKITLNTSEKISIEKLLILQTYAGWIEGNPVEISEKIRLKPQIKIEHEFGCTQAL